MTWLDNIRHKSNDYKLRLIGAILVGVLIVMVGIWIVIGNYHYGNGTGPDLRFFQTIGSGIKSLTNTHQ